MSYTLKNKQLILKLIIIIIFLAISVYISLVTYRDFSYLEAETGLSYDYANISIDVEIRVGDEYDITEHLNDAKALLNKKAIRGVHGVYNLQTIDIYEKRIIDLNDRTVRGNKSGYTTITYGYRYYSQFYGNALFPSNTIIETIPLLELNIIVLDLEEDYIPVSSIGDLSHEYRTYILMNDITSTRGIWGFNGVLLNPNNYTITINFETNLKSIFSSNNGYIKGLICNLIIDNSADDNLVSYYMGEYNEGIITDSTFNITYIGKTIPAFGLINNENYIKNCIINAHFTVLEGGMVTFHDYSFYKNNTLTITINGDTNNILQPSDDMIANNTITIIIEEENS